MKAKKSKPIIIPFIALLSLALFSSISSAQEAMGGSMEEKLLERDKVILELLDRIEALESRFGVSSNPGKERDRSGERSLAGNGDDPSDSADKTPGKVAVDEKDFERALERALSTEGALLLRWGVFEVDTGLSYARNEGGAPVFVTSGDEVSVGEEERNTNTLTANVGLRMGLPWDSQVELSIPYRWREVESVTTVGFSATETSKRYGSGLGDLRIGLAKTLFREGLSRPDLVMRLTWDSATGDTGDDGVGLGGGFHEIQGALTAIKRLDPVVFVGGISYDHTLEKHSVRPGPVIGANMGGYVSLNPEATLNLSFSAAHRLETEIDGAKLDGSDQTLASLNIGGSILQGRGTILNIGVGMGLTDDADDFSVSLSVSTRFGNPSR